MVGYVVRCVAVQIGMASLGVLDKPHLRIRYEFVPKSSPLLCYREQAEGQ